MKNNRQHRRLSAAAEAAMAGALPTFGRSPAAVSLRKLGRSAALAKKRAYKVYSLGFRVLGFSDFRV